VAKPDVFEAPAVVEAVYHRDEAFDVLEAGGRSRLVDDRWGAVLGQSTLDLPYQPLALLLIEFD